MAGSILQAQRTHPFTPPEGRAKVPTQDDLRLANNLLMNMAPSQRSVPLGRAAGRLKAKESLVINPSLISRVRTKLAALQEKRAFTPMDAQGSLPDPTQGGGMPPGGAPPGMPPGMDPSQMGGGMPPGMDPSMMGGGMPPGGAEAAMAGMPPGGDPSQGGGGDPSQQPVMMTAADVLQLAQMIAQSGMMGQGGQPGQPAAPEGASAQGAGKKPSKDETMNQISQKLDQLLGILSGGAGGMPPGGAGGMPPGGPPPPMGGAPSAPPPAMPTGMPPPPGGGMTAQASLRNHAKLLGNLLGR